MAMFPHERSLVKRLEGRPFALIGVNSDTGKEEIKKLNEEAQITWRSFWNGPEGTGGPISRKWNIRGWPTLYIVDANGVIRHKWTGNPGNKVLDEAIDKLVEEAEEGQKKSEVSTKPVGQTKENGKVTVAMADSDEEYRVFPDSRRGVKLKRGVLSLDGEQYTVFLPKASTYSIKNPSERNLQFSNKSTFIGIDQNRDGELQSEERWFSNMPVRIKDSMFEVKEIASDGSQVVLAPSQSPLQGAVVGRPCPPFEVKTADGQVFNLETLAGKAFVLDIWSIT